jgi:predicted RNA-binding Zn-ribbon protein involved in translation (DUF1610 family)
MSDSKDCRPEFKPIADEYRRKSAILKWVGLVAIAFWALLWFPKYKGYGFTGFVICIVGGIITSFIWLPKLICPSCKRKLYQQNGSLGEYCPECGEKPVVKGWFCPKCTACGKRLSRGRGGANYEIRYCTWCGAHVDEVGI